MQKLQGWVEQGNTTLTIAGAAGTIARKVQGSYPLATVTVYINNAPAVAITSISRAANVVTVTISANSNFIAGELVTIAGVTDASFNGTFTILSSGSTTFTYAQTAANASSSSGTASSTLRLATIYADNSSTAKANPFTASSDGTWFVYAANGNYDVKFSGAGITSPFTIGDLQSFSPQVIDNVAHAALFPGADASIKIANAIASLPSTGGIVDARGFQGTQTFSVNPFAGIPSVNFPLTVLFGAATFHVQTTMILDLAATIQLLGISVGGGIETGSVFVWDGANGGTVLFFNTTRDSYVDGISIKPGTGTIGIGILSDNVHPAGSSNSTNIHFRHITVDASTVGIQIGKDQVDGNNAEMTFEDVYILGAGTYGYFIKFSQSRNLSFMRGTVGSRTFGIYFNNGSGRIYGVNFSQNTTDIYCVQADDTIMVEACHSELSGRFLDTGGPSGSNFAVFLAGNQFTADNINTLNPFLRYRYTGPFVMTGNDFTEGNYHATPKMDISSSNPTVIVSLGNVFPNDQIFTGATGAYTLTSLGDRTFDAGNNPQRMPNKMQQALTLEAQLDVFGAITTGSNLSAAGNLTVVGGATIGGAAAITGAITGASASVTGNLHSGGAFDVAGTAAIGSTISVGGETAQAHLLSGTYTPTLTNVANISASHMIEDASYVQVGKEIVVSGRINLTPTAGGNVTTEIDLTVPILNSSNVDAMGGAVTSGAVGLSGVATFGVSFGNGNKIRLVASQVTNTSAIDYSFIISYHLA